MASTHARWALLFAGLAACGNVSSNTDAAVHDAPRSIDAAPDADTRACDPAKAFGQPQPIMELNTSAADAYVFLSPDELTGYVTTNGGPSPQGSYDLYVTTRTSITAPFGTLTPLSPLNSAAGQEAPSLTSDGRTIYYFDSSVGGGGDIFTATRSSVTTDFGAGTSVAVINSTTAFDHCPFVSPDGLTMYFCSTRNSGTTSYDLFVTTRTSSSGFSAPVELTELNGTTSSDSDAVATPDGLTIYYSSDRTGTAGGSDIWRASRASKSDPFGSITNVSVLNSALDDWPTWVSADDCRLYFASDRGGGQGSHDLYVAVRPK